MCQPGRDLADSLGSWSWALQLCQEPWYLGIPAGTAMLLLLYPSYDFYFILLSALEVQAGTGGESWPSLASDFIP